jgi:DNA-binding NarL/FixJ family response regulator
MVRLVIAMHWENELKHTTITLGAHADFSVIGTALDCYQALQVVVSEQPDVVVLDYYLDSIKGWELIPTIKRKSPATSVIIISPYDDDAHAWDAMNRGASAYLVRKFDMEILAGTIHVVHTGGRYISHRIVNSVLPKLHMYQEYCQDIVSMKKSAASRRRKNFIRLSQTEKKIIGYISQGRTTKEIAEILNLKTGTIRNYISRLIHKMGGRTRAQMIFSALANGLAE